MPCNLILVWLDILDHHFGDKPRNPLAFVHEGLNLLPAQIMSKPLRITLSEEQNCPFYAVDFSPPLWACQYKE
jgi:hypothetical protein